MKKLITLLLISGAVFLFGAMPVLAATPILSLSNTGEGDNVQMSVSGDANSSIILNFQKTDGSNRLQYIGTTNATGYYSTTISTAELGVTPSSSVQVKVNNILSASTAWPYTTISGSGAITLSKTGLIMTVGDNATLTVNNAGSNKLYLLNNSNPQIANVNLASGQATIYANTFGQTVATICVLGTTSNCASTYVTVQNSGAKALTLSQSSLTIAYGQSSQVTILNSTGNYTILNNSNPSVITATIKDQIITLLASNNGGSAAITVCSTDMSACGIINANVGALSSATLTFNQTAPTFSIGQTLTVAITGGSNYNISSNSNSNIVNAYINNNTLTLVGSLAGSSVITVCSSNGNCNSLTATVSYASSGGPISLSQSSLWLQVGQAVSVVISGGTAPYSFINDANSSKYFQTSLSTNIITLTGISAGSASLSVCSAGGACTQLSVLVNGVSSNTQLTFGNNNLNLKAGATSDVSLYGSGGYYISNTNNLNVATFAVNGTKVTVNALTAGNANATVCQTGGQCGVIYAAVSSEYSIIPITFFQSNPTITIGQTLTNAIRGGSSNSYYVSSNSNPSIVQANLSGTNLIILGKINGRSVITICSASNNCGSMSVEVGIPNTTISDNNNNTTADTAVVSAAESKIFFTGDLTSILKNINVAKNASLEATVKVKNLTPLITSYKPTAAQINSLNYFLTYGSQKTIKMSPAERTGYLGAYLYAFSSVPKTEGQWNDLLNIASGNDPVYHSLKAENQAKLEFKKVYNRVADTTKDADRKAIMFIAYGINPLTRNLTNETKAIKTFRSVYNHAPANTLAWNIVRAVAYSGL